MGTRSAYSNEEWVEIVNGAAKYLRAMDEPDGTFIGSLKEAMANFVAHIPNARIEGSSLAAVLPLTGIVSNGGRREGHTVWSISDHDITIDDWVRMTYLRRNSKAESKQKKPNQRGSAVPQRARIDESLTGHPEIVVTPERDFKAELESARTRIEDLLEKLEIEVDRRKELERLLADSSKDLEDNIRLRRLLRFVAENPETLELFKVGMEIGGQ